MSQFVKRILKARPSAQVAVVGADLYENIVWGSETPVPEATLLAQDAAVAADEAAAVAEKAAIAKTKTDTKADAFVQQFVNMTPAQVIAHVNSNVANLADAKQLLTKLALMMLAIAKEQYK